MHTLLPTLTLVIALTTAIRLPALLNYLGFSDVFFIIFFFDSTADSLPFLATVSPQFRVTLTMSEFFPYLKNTSLRKIRRKHRSFPY